MDETSDLTSPGLATPEKARLSALAGLRILDTPPEAAFDRITRLAAKLLGTPISLVSLVDESRQWFKSRYGLDTEWTEREIAFCDHAIRGTEPLVVVDALADERFARNPLVRSDPNIRFYAGAPLVLAGGHAVGTLCVIDRRPRPDFGPQQAQILVDLADMVVERLEARSVLQALREEADAHRRTEEALRRSVAERDVLLREIHHRVKNNLQAIASIVQVEATRLERGSPARRILDSIGERIAVMFSVHQKLYTTEELDRVDIGEQVRDVARRLGRLHCPDGRIRLDLRCEAVWLDSDTALRVGLIANELIANSLCHAYPPGTLGSIRVSVARDSQGIVRLVVADDGGGAGAAKNQDGVGLLLARALAQQIDARLEAGPAGNGWRAELMLT